eukprot:NODE_524_length_6494_cov_0.362783.p2 type:complete len:115 gc:universal NODE_524_length_6494_cov_0.362783:5271-5615(+)
MDERFGPLLCFLQQILTRDSSRSGNSCVFNRCCPINSLAFKLACDWSTSFILFIGVLSLKLNSLNLLIAFSGVNLLRFKSLMLLFFSFSSFSSFSFCYLTYRAFRSSSSHSMTA